MSIEAVAEVQVVKGILPSETRIGWNRSSLDRLNDFWLVLDPRVSGDEDLTDPARRVGQMTLSSGFSTPTAEVLAMRGRSYITSPDFGKLLSAQQPADGAARRASQLLNAAAVHLFAPRRIATSSPSGSTRPGAGRAGRWKSGGTTGR